MGGQQQPWLLPASVFAVLLLLSPWQAIAAETGLPYYPNEMMCGPECLWLVAHLYGKDPSLESLVLLARTDGRTGTTVRDMMRACEHLGLFAEVVRTNLATLLDDARYDILLASGDRHFVVLLGADNENVFIVDGRSRRAVSRAAFAKYWGGVAITVGSTRPWPAPWTIGAVAIGASFLLSLWIASRRMAANASRREQARERGWFPLSD